VRGVVAADLVAAARRPEPVLGFRVPLQLCDEAFAAATASLDR
jgi:hypothetical protein